VRQGLPKVTGHHALHSSLLSIVLPWMTPLLVGVGALAVTLLVAVPLVLRRNRWPKRLSARLARAGLATAVLAVLVAPTAWTVATIDSRYGGSAIAPPPAR
jgi:cytochrome bd-type quinol oxidase subunit 1